MRPVDCAHLLEPHQSSDSVRCAKCGLVVSGEDIECCRRKLPNGTREPYLVAAERAAKLLVASGKFTIEEKAR